MALVDDIQRLYIAYFNRPADPTGLAYWTDQANRNGGSTATIANAFSASTEYTVKYAGQSTTTLINTIYLNLFGRAAEPAGIQYWGSRLDGGTFNIGNIVTAILGGAQNADAVAVSNKAQAATLFTQNLTTPAQIAAYTTPAAVAIALAWLNKVVDAASLITAQQGLQTVITTIVGGTPPATGGGVSGQTFTLTTGVDSGATFLGGAGDDTYNASAGTLNATDILNGGAGSNALNVTESGAISLLAGSVAISNIQAANFTSTSTIALDTTAWTGLTALNVLGAQGAVALTSAATTAIVVQETGAGQTAGAITINGGSTVKVSSIHNTGGAISVGATTAPTGAVQINSSVDAASTGGLISVKGGTTVTVTQTATNAAGTNVTAESAVTVDGGATTTTVTVTQAPVAAGATAVSAVAGVSGIAAVTAAPGTAAVTARTAVSTVAAVTAVSGVTANGAVNITDSNYNTVAANTIGSVTLNNYGASSNIKSNALTSLSLSGTAGTLALTNATNGAGGVPTAVTTLGLTLNGLSGTNAITDTNNEITVLNVTTTGTDSTLAAFADTALTTVNVSGSNVLRLNAINGSLTGIKISGAAGFNDGGTTAANGFAARGAAATLTTTSSGAITASLDSTTQSFIGSTGKDTIRISSTTNATQTITGGSGATDELILEGGAYALSNATGLKVTGFETLGVAANVTGTINMAQLATGFTGLHIIGNSTINFSNVATGTALSLNVASTSVSYSLASANGANSSVNVILGTATSDTVNFGTVILKDSNSVGIGTVNLVSNGVDVTAGDSTANNNTVILTDNGLSTLNFSGTQGLAITTLNEASTQATAITLNNTNTSSFGLLIGVLTDSVLGSLTFTGSGSSTITTLTDSSASSLTISNTGSQLATVGTFTASANLTSLTLNGNVQIGDGLVGGTGLTATNTTSITVNGASDNAHVKLSLGAAAFGQVNNVNLGNGNNVIIDATIAGTSNITVGTGSNFLTIGGATTNTTGLFNINLGTHTLAGGADYITVGTGGTAYATTANYVITGASVGDRIIFNTDAAATLVGHTAGVITATTAGATAALTITALEAAVDALAAHGVAYAVFGGNTYVAESISSTLAGTDTTIVQISGVHTVSAGTSGYVMIAS
jgi:S-layer protein